MLEQFHDFFLNGDWEDDIFGALNSFASLMHLSNEEYTMLECLINDDDFIVFKFEIDYY